MAGGTGQHDGPTVSRIVLGTHLRRLREAAGITREEAGHAIRASHAKISRLELGRVGFKERDVADLLTLYGVTDEAERADVLELMRQANTKVWWQQHSDLLPNWFETYLRLEQVAKVIRTYQLQFVPGLLQSEEYARAVIGHGHSRSTDELDRRVQLRMERQQMLHQPEAPHLWAVIDEAALHRLRCGGPLCRQQVEHLLELAELPNVSLQIATFDRGVHPATGGPFTILRFPVQDLPDVVYLEHLNGALYLDKATDVEDYIDVWHRLCTHIDPPEHSWSTLERIRSEVCEPG